MSIYTINSYVADTLYIYRVFLIGGAKYEYGNLFTTPYVYEIETKGEPIWQMHNENKVSSPHNYEKAKKTFLHVCDFLKNFLSKGDYCEIYICWIGEEGEDHEKKFELSLYQLPVDEVEIDEKCLMMLRN